VLRTKLSRYGMATAGAAVGAIMAISPVFAQGTSSNTTTDSSTLLSDILAAAQKANLTAEQIKELLEVAGEFTIQNTASAETEASAAETEVDEDVDEDDDDTAEVAAATTTKQEKKHTTVTVTFTVPKSSEEKGGDD